MKWRILAVMAMCALGCHQEAGKPLLAYNSEVINVGAVKLGAAYSGRFILRNPGTADLLLGDITTDCQCTVAKIDNSRVPPGDSLWVSYSVHPNIDGYFQQKIIIKNNTDSSNPAMFVVRGQVVR